MEAGCEGEVFGNNFKEGDREDQDSEMMPEAKRVVPYSVKEELF